MDWGRDREAARDGADSWTGPQVRGAAGGPRTPSFDSEKQLGPQQDTQLLPCVGRPSMFCLDLFQDHVVRTANASEKLGMSWRLPRAWGGAPSAITSPAPPQVVAPGHR